MTRRSLFPLVAAAVIAVAACGGSGSTTAPSTTQAPNGLGAQVASYDLAANVPNRFLLGIVGGEGTVVVGGTIQIRFAFVGAAESSSVSLQPATSASAPATVTATFTPIAGATAPDAVAPRLGRPSEGVGVYEASGITFDQPGSWEAVATGTVDGAPFEVTAAFPVLPAHRIRNAGDPAPRTVNLLPGDATAPAAAVESRADSGTGAVPDPELHRLTVADAIAAGKPTLVVISTPVYCISRFCGPITDSVQRLAQGYGDQASFVHLEVWRDFQNSVLNKAAAEWIYPDPGVDAAEPWTFLVGRDGTILQRWDNVASDAQLTGALQAALR